MPISNRSALEAHRQETKVETAVNVARCPRVCKVWLASGKFDPTRLPIPYQNHFLTALDDPCLAAVNTVVPLKGWVGWEVNLPAAEGN